MPNQNRSQRNGMNALQTVGPAVMLLIAIVSCTAADKPVPQKPVIVGDWKRMTAMPDLGQLAGPQPQRQHIVDHGLMQDAEGNWRIWACLRGTAVSRLLYGWKSPELFVESWEPVGVVARAQARFGERVKDSGEETMGAPFFLKERDTWYWFYHSAGFRLMTSSDGVNFERAADWGPKGNLTSIPGCRDVTIMKHDDTFYSYAAVTTPDAKRGYIVAATSPDLKQWNNRGIVCEAPPGQNGKVSAESPFVVCKDGLFYLWRASSHDFRTSVYRSADPLDFAPGTDDKLIDTVRLKAPEVIQYGGKWFITDLHDFQGIRMSELTWEVDEAAASEVCSGEVGEFSIPKVSPLNPRQLQTMRRLVSEHPEAAALAERARGDALLLLDASSAESVGEMGCGEVSQVVK